MTLYSTSRLFASRLEVEDADGVLQGAVQTAFSLTQRRLDVYDARDRPIMEATSPLFGTLTSQVRRRGRDAGVITREWRGLFRLGRDDADSFGVKFAPGASLRDKMLLLATTVLINSTFFEDEK